MGLVHCKTLALRLDPFWMLVYSGDTTSIAMAIILNYLDESLTYEGSLVTSGPSMKLERFSVTELTLDTIGLMPIGDLCIFRNGMF